MNDLEIKRKSVEILRVEAAKAEMELLIEEKLSEIERIKKNIEIQKARISELKEWLSKEGNR
jgi:hypothetical protein